MRALTPTLVGLLLLSLAASVVACGESEPPRFLQVSYPELAYRDEPALRVVAQVHDDRAVVSVSAVVLPPRVLDQALVSPQDQERITGTRVAFSRAEGEFWEGELTTPEAGDLVFFLQAEDEEGEIGFAPDDPIEGVEIPPDDDGPWFRLYVIPISERYQRCGAGLPECPSGETCRERRCLPAGLCADVVCPAGQACHPDTGVCLLSGDCRLPDNACPSGTSCDDLSGSCVALDLCAGVECDPGTACDPATGRCVVALCAGVDCGPGRRCHSGTGECLVEGHCRLPESPDCPAGTECDFESGQCVAADLCAGVRCEAGYACDSSTGDCVPDCARVGCPGPETCDPDTGLCSIPEGGLCAPCESRFDCGGDPDLCILYGDHRACGRTCDPDTAPCPERYECTRFGSSIRQCVYELGSCE